MKDVMIELTEFGLDSLSLKQHKVPVADESHLAIAHLLDLIGQTNYLIELAFATILSGNFVLSASPYVANERKLSLAQVVLAQTLVELVHR